MTAKKTTTTTSASPTTKKSTKKVAPVANVPSASTVPAVETAGVSTTAGAFVPPPSAREQTLGFISMILSLVDEQLSPMAEGDKLSMEALCSSIAKSQGAKQEKIYPLVSMYLNRRSDISVFRGRDGGIFKGARAPKSVDPTKAEKLNKQAGRDERKAAELLANAAKKRAAAGVATTVAASPAN